MGLFTNMASTYFFLLKSVKYNSKKDNVWISFYEGLNQHAAIIILSLLSDTFNTNMNVFHYNSLTTDYFKEQQLQHFLPDTKSPNKHLNNILEGISNAPMLTMLFNVRGIIPKIIPDIPPPGAVNEFTRNFANTVNSSVT